MYHFQPLRATVNLRAMAMKGYSTFPKAQALLELHYLIILYHIQDPRSGGPCLSEEKQSVYSKALTDTAKKIGNDVLTDIKTRKQETKKLTNKQTDLKKK